MYVKKKRGVTISTLTEYGNKIDRHYTFGGKELSCFCKMLGFQVFNTVVASAVFYLWSDLFAKGRHTWYANGAPMVLNVLVGDMLIINLGMDLARPDVLFKQRVLSVF